MFAIHKATICWVLIVAMALSPSIVYAQPPATPAPTETKAGERPDVSYVVPGAAFGAVAFPRRVLTAPEMWMMPIEVISAAGKKEAGIDPLDIEQIIAFAEAPQPGAPPAAGVVVRFTRPYRMDSLLPNLQPMTEEAQIEGKPYRRAMGPMAPSMYMPDDRTLLLATEPMLQKMVANRAKPAASKMSEVLSRVGGTSDVAAVCLLEPLRPLLNAQLAQAPLPPPFADVKKLPDMIDMIGIKATLVGQPSGMLSVTARDEATAIELQKLIDQWLELAHQMMLAQMAEDMARRSAGEDPVETAAVQYFQRVSGAMFDALRPVRKDKRLILASEGEGPQAQVATIGILIALLLPAVQAARAAARRAASMNNLKQLGLAMHNHMSAMRTLPARAICDKQGKPLLSWRVRILPYLEEAALYDQFHLDEPWDSPHNKTLIDKMPAVFRNPASEAPPNTTTYLVPVGPGTLFEGNKGPALNAITDGMSNTVMMVEANDDQAVIWTKPDDWQYNPEKPLAGLGTAHLGVFNVLFCDGSVRTIAADMAPEAFKAFLTIAGAEPINAAAF